MTLIPDALFHFQKDLGLVIEEVWFLIMVLMEPPTRDLEDPYIKATYGMTHAETDMVVRSLLHKRMLTTWVEGSYPNQILRYDVAPLWDRIRELVIKSAGGAS